MQGGVDMVLRRFSRLIGRHGGWSSMSRRSCGVGGRELVLLENHVAGWNAKGVRSPDRAAWQLRVALSR
jgi:hypothetical protein